MPVVAPLKASPVAATPGSEPSASVAFHTPITGIALAVAAKPCSSSAVTSSVSERFPFTESEDHAECPYPQSVPCHHPCELTAAGAASTPSATTWQPLAGLSGENTIKVCL